MLLAPVFAFTLAQVVFNEIQYHPVTDAREDEFLEIRNASDKAVNLSGWRITGGVSFTFPAGTALEPGARAVVASAPEHLAEKFGLDAVYGPFTGSLGNEGETLLLENAIGAVADGLSYSDRRPWPARADGYGPSLERTDPRLRGEGC